jgi:serine/threonine protein kinase
MAPEQFAGACKDPRVDLYAAGIMLYEFLTGDVPSRWFEQPGAAHPYMPIPPSQANPGAGIPATLDAVTLKAIAFNPDDRYQTADDGSRSPRRAPRCASWSRWPRRCDDLV